MPSKTSKTLSLDKALLTAIKRTNPPLGALSRSSIEKVEEAIKRALEFT